MIHLIRKPTKQDVAGWLATRTMNGMDEEDQEQVARTTNLDNLTNPLVVPLPWRATHTIWSFFLAFLRHSNCCRIIFISIMWIVLSGQLCPSPSTAARECACVCTGQSWPLPVVRKPVNRTIERWRRKVIVEGREERKRRMGGRRKMTRKKNELLLLLWMGANRVHTMSKMCV